MYVFVHFRNAKVIEFRVVTVSKTTNRSYLPELWMFDSDLLLLYILFWLRGANNS